MKQNTSRKWLYILILTSLLVSLAITSASAAPLKAAAVDGDGVITVSPTNVPYGSGSVTLIFTFTANNDFGSGSQVQISIPGTWTKPITTNGSGKVTVSAGTCTLSGAPPFAVSNYDILIDISSCPTGQSFTVTYANATPGPVSVTPYTFTVFTDIGTGGSGLVPTNAPAPTVSVDPKTVTVTGITTSAKTYNGTTTATLNFGSAALQGVLAGDVGKVSLNNSGYTADFDTQHVGTAKTVTISGLTLSGTAAGNYLLTQPTSSGNITARAITITAATDTKTYDGGVTSSVPASLTAGTIAVGDTTPTWTQIFNNKNIGAGNKVLSPNHLVVSDGNSGNDYAYTYVTVATGTINKRPITIDAVTDTKTYDGSTSSSAHPTLTSGTIAAGDTEPSWSQTFDNKNIGSGNKVLTPAGVVADGNSGNNYLYNYTTDTTGTINAKTLTVSATGLTPASKIYDGTVSASITVGSPSLVGVVSPDVVTLITTGVSKAFADRNAGTSKTVNISGLTLGGGGAGNYTLTQPTRTANISKRPITINAISDSKTYDGTVSSNGVPTLSISTPLASGDSAPAWTQAFNSKHAGSGNKILTPAGLVNDGNSGNNYVYTYATVSNGTISKLSITVAAVSDSKAYDGLTTSSGVPLLSGATPLAAGDGAPVWSQSFANKNAGTGKTINPAGLVSDGNGGNNYTYNFVPDVNGAITVRAITVTAMIDTKTYDSTTASSVLPNINPALVGTDSPAFIQTFDTADAGSNKTLTPSGTVNDGNSGLNYQISFSAITTGTINKATPTLSITNSPVTYDGATHTASVSASAAGNVSNILTGGAATQTEPGSYAVTADFAPTYTTNYNNLTGAAAGNFVINKINATLSVTNSPVAYNGLPHAVKVASTVAGSISSIKYNGSATAPTNAGTYAITANFTPTDMAHYNSLVAAAAGKFVITKERVINGGLNLYTGTSKVPTSWVASQFSTSDGKDTSAKKEGAASVKIAGAAGKTKTLTQTLTLSGASGDKFIFTFWAKGASIPTAGLCQAQVILYNGSLVKLTKTIACSNGTYAAFGKKTLSFSATTAYTKVVIKFTYSKASGTVWFDSVSLVK